MGAKKERKAKERAIREFHAKAIWESVGPDDVQGTELECLPDFRYAVHYGRSDDGWLTGAASVQDLADHYLQAALTDGEDAEWIEAVYDLLTGQPVAITRVEAHVVTVSIGPEQATAAMTYTVG